MVCRNENAKNFSSYTRRGSSSTKRWRKATKTVLDTGPGWFTVRQRVVCPSPLGTRAQRAAVQTSPAPFSLPVRANQVVATLRLPKTAPIPICLGAANLSGVLPGKRTARIVAQARQVAARGEKNGRTTGLNC